MSVTSSLTLYSKEYSIYKIYYNIIEMGTLQGYVSIFEKDKQDHHGYMYMYWHDMMLGNFCYTDSWPLSPCHGSIIM